MLMHCMPASNGGIARAYTHKCSIYVFSVFRDYLLQHSGVVGKRMRAKSWTKYSFNAVLHPFTEEYSPPPPLSQRVSHETHILYVADFQCS